MLRFMLSYDAFHLLILGCGMLCYAILWCVVLCVIVSCGRHDDSQLLVSCISHVFFSCYTGPLLFYLLPRSDYSILEDKPNSRPWLWIGFGLRFGFGLYKQGQFQIPSWCHVEVCPEPDLPRAVLQSWLDGIRKRSVIYSLRCSVNPAEP